ncbi:MAG TPA: hypothetical protein VN893_20370, partial [Bryobacteraceae bacterium]|nr:hypothetical protein [Bryobacteraceae bacterium]
MKSSLFVVIICCAAPLCLPSLSVAGEITDPSNSFAVGIGPNGELYDFTTSVGFQRLSDGFDPLAPGTPRDSWGVTANGSSNYADQTYYGTGGVSSTVTLGANSATVTTTTTIGLQVKQVYQFAASGNILEIKTTLTNVGDLLATGVGFQRDVDWDVTPTEFGENSFGHAVTGNVVDSSYYGFESPDPLDAYGASCAAGCNQTGDLGGGIKLGLANLAPGASESFTYLYGINLSPAGGDGGQTVNGLITEAQGLGAYYWIATQSTE